MSAFLVCPEHIHALVHFAHRSRDVPSVMLFDNGWTTFARGNLWMLGQRLYDANVEAIGARYPGDVDMVWYQWPDDLPELVFITPIQALKGCDCFEYQASEWPHYPDSDAERIINVIRKVAIYQLPGYDDARWEIRGRKVAA